MAPATPPKTPSQNLTASLFRFDGRGRLLIGYDHIGGISPNKVGIRLVYTNQPDLGIPIPMPNPSINGSRVTYALDISKIPFGMTRDQLASDWIDLLVDPLNSIKESNEYDNSIRINLPFIRKIPQIMSNLGSSWSVAADFQKKWFNGRSLQWPVGTNGTRLTISQVLRSTSNVYSVETLDPKWLFAKSVDTDSRVKTSFQKLLAGKYLFSSNALGVLQRRVVEAYQNRASHGSPLPDLAFPIGNKQYFDDRFNPRKKLDMADLRSIASDSFQFSTVETPLAAIDPITGALGNFSFYAVASGSGIQISKGANAGKYRILLPGTSIYMIDSFEFNDYSLISQNLGFWDPLTGPHMFPGLKTQSVTNKDYNNYRTLTGMGGDFLIASQAIGIAPIAAENYLQGIFDPISLHVSWVNTKEQYKSISPAIVT
jgi:hypothetical protein